MLNLNYKTDLRLIKKNRLINQGLFQAFFDVGDLLLSLFG